MSSLMRWCSRSKLWYVLVLLTTVLMAVSNDGVTATREQVMASRYLKTQFCIERVLGQRWHERYDIPLVINRWGISEPTQAGLANGPESLRRAHARCRADNEIGGEPIPR